jgi:hypothetical protein
MLDNFRSKNPNIEFYSVEDYEFKSYGVVLQNIDVNEICGVANSIEMPGAAVKYVPSEQKFETLEIAEIIQKQVYGGVNSQLGCCWGYNTLLNATEWHTCDEINIAVTPMVLLLAHIWDIEDNRLDSAKFRAFYLPEGTSVRLFSSTLHYTPCQVSDDGFKCVVGLVKNTNTALDFDATDKKLVGRNKWLIAHIDNEAKRSQGAIMGITGENFDIKY